MADHRNPMPPGEPSGPDRAHSALPTPPAIATDVRTKLDALQSQLDALEDLVTGTKVPGGLVALTVPIKVEEALHAVILELQRNKRFRQQVLLACGRLQQHFKTGPLTALIEVVSGE